MEKVNNFVKSNPKFRFPSIKNGFRLIRDSKNLSLIIKYVSNGGEKNKKFQELLNTAVTAPTLLGRTRCQSLCESTILHSQHARHTYILCARLYALNTN